MQQYTLDKILESRFKKVINYGEDPTIIDPEQYKKRFKEAMNKYFVPLYPDKNASKIFEDEEEVRQSEFKMKVSSSNGVDGDTASVKRGESEDI